MKPRLNEPLLQAAQVCTGLAIHHCVWAHLVPPQAECFKRIR